MDRAHEDRHPDSAPEGRRSFPTNAVVGVVDDPDDLAGVSEELRADGIEPRVYCSERGAEAILHSEHPDLDVQLTRVAQGMFGYESEHSDRHMAEIDAGHFVVVAESRDDETTDRIRDAFASHSGHFVNYYSSWTSRTLIP
jgi:hypothetical protein